ncbi:hypothetical protein H0V99_02415 [Candidatus Saccharibacteria bacterium]|nr:hypothetical protein [Candidatus Saccharibacteria bacterium]
MAQNVKLLKNILPKMQNALVIPSLALRSVTSKSGSGVYASSDTLFKGAIFGRDSLEVAEDLMMIKPRLVVNILTTLASLQGQTHNKINEEEPGKIIHEYRNVIVDGKSIDDTSMSIFKSLSEKWGGNEKEMAYYGAIDPTPHFLRTLGRYCEMKGPKILESKISLRNGKITTMHDVAAQAVQWIMDKLDSSQTGLLEYKRANPHGILNQVWKDSDEFYVHEDKQLANHSAPIGSIEVQGITYDGLMAAAIFFPESAPKYIAAAKNLRDRTIELLWLKDRNYFALGTDFSPEGKLRIIKTRTANPAALLDTEFFNELPAEKRHNFIEALVEYIMSSDFVTDAGIRSRALSAAHLIEFWDYHGSYVSWPKETYDIAKGLRRQGLTKLAYQLENRLLNVYLKTREYPEFLYVDLLGRVLASSPSSHTHGELMLVDSTNNPERIQAWTVSAIIAIMNYQLKDRVIINEQAKQSAWQKSFEKKVLAKLPKVGLYLNPIALWARYPTYGYRLTKSK